MALDRDHRNQAPSQETPTPQPSLPVPVAEIPLLEQVAKLRFRIPRRHRRHKAFFRQLKRVATRPESLRMLKRFRDSIIRTSLKREGERSGTVVAVAGVDGGEGASLLFCASHRTSSWRPRSIICTLSSPPARLGSPTWTSASKSLKKLALKSVEWS